MTYDEYRAHLLVALDSIEINLSACLSGNRAGALNLSTQIWKLLCDRQGGNALVEKVIPSFSLQPVRHQPKPGVEYRLYDLASVTFGNDQITIQLLDSSKPKIPLSQWLEQLVTIASAETNGVTVTIKDYLFHLRNSEGAHFHNNPRNNPREVTRAIKTGMANYRINGEVYPADYLYLLILSSYIVEEIRLQLP